MPNGPMRITGTGLFDPSTCKSEHSVKDEDLKVRLESMKDDLSMQRLINI